MNAQTCKECGSTYLEKCPICAAGLTVTTIARPPVPKPPPAPRGPERWNRTIQERSSISAHADTIAIYSIATFGRMTGHAIRLAVAQAWQRVFDWPAGDLTSRIRSFSYDATGAPLLGRLDPDAPPVAIVVEVRQG